MRNFFQKWTAKPRGGLITQDFRGWRGQSRQWGRSERGKALESASKETPWMRGSASWVKAGSAGCRTQQRLASPRQGAQPFALTNRKKVSVADSMELSGPSQHHHEDELRYWVWCPPLRAQLGGGSELRTGRGPPHGVQDPAFAWICTEHSAGWGSSLPGPGLSRTPNGSLAVCDFYQSWAGRKMQIKGKPSTNRSMVPAPYLGRGWLTFPQLLPHSSFLLQPL